MAPGGTAFAAPPPTAWASAFAGVANVREGGRPPAVLHAWTRGRAYRGVRGPLPAAGQWVASSPSSASTGALGDADGTGRVVADSDVAAANGGAPADGTGNGVVANNGASMTDVAAAQAANGVASKAAPTNGAPTNGESKAEAAEAGISPSVGALNYILISTALGGNHSANLDRSNADTEQPRSATEKALLELVAPLPSPPRLRVMLVGKPVSGKGTQAMLISRKYGLPHISLGDMLRAEMSAGTDLGKEVDAKVREGELLPDDLVLSILKRRLAQDDCVRHGYILDGFPRSASQSEAMAREDVKVDIILLLDRSDEDALFWSRGRATDPKTGIIYHNVLNPPPSEEIAARLIRRSDDDMSVAAKRMKAFSTSFDEVYGRWSDVLVRVDTSNCRTIMSVFEDVSKALDSLCPDNEATNWHAFGSGREPASSPAKQAVIEAKEAHLEEFIQNRIQKASQLVLPAGSMLNAVKQCCGYRLLEAQAQDPGKYLPFIVDDQRLGHVGRAFATELMEANVNLNVFAVELESCGLDGWTQMPGSVRASPELLSLPVPERTERVGKLMKRLHQRGLIQGWRNELHPISRFFKTETVFEMERACLPYFGLRGYGVHVNGYVRKNGQLFVWVATRSHAKATYAGLFDQMVAGGLPSGVSLIENVAKEAVEEAGVELGDLDSLTSVGSLSYRYVECARRWGLDEGRTESIRDEVEWAGGRGRGQNDCHGGGMLAVAKLGWEHVMLLSSTQLRTDAGELTDVNICFVPPRDFWDGAFSHRVLFFVLSLMQLRDKKRTERQIAVHLRRGAFTIVCASKPGRGSGGIQPGACVDRPGVHRLQLEGVEAQFGCGDDRVCGAPRGHQPHIGARLLAAV